MIDHLEAIRRESARFADCIRRASFDADVPSCPGWTVADLAWHLTDVQDFWGSIAHDLVEDPDTVTKVERPDDSMIADLFDERSARMYAALARQPADARCWTWDDKGWTIGWVRRRQAHEALIHRLDAELAIGEVTPLDEELATDGIQEMLDIYLGDVPSWGSFTADGGVATISVDGGPSWGLHFGRFRGTGPESGTDWDFDTVVTGEPSGPVIAGTGSALDAWLWGRGGDGVRSDDPEAMDRLRTILADALQ